MGRKKKKLLYFVEAMGGGVFTYIVALSNQLVNDYDIYIAYAVRSQTPENYKDYFDTRIHLIQVENFARSLNAKRDLKAFFEIRRIAKQIQPDIIHLHSSKAGALGRWAFNGQKTAMFYTPHGYSFLMNNQSVVKRSIFKFIETVCSKRYCTTISCSQGEHQETLKLTKNAVYVDNGIDCAELDTLLHNIELKEHAFTVFTLGRICYQKNPALFNQIALTMLDTHFLWIGDGERRNELSAPNIEITGWADRNTALTKAMNTDVFILTSLWEGLPISLLEAMYMKKTCVVSDVIGNHDVIHNGVNGFVCNHVPEYTKAIQECKTASAAVFAEQAYQDILESYNTNVMAEKYRRIYMEHSKTT